MDLKSYSRLGMWAYRAAIASSIIGVVAYSIGSRAASVAAMAAILLVLAVPILGTFLVAIASWRKSDILTVASAVAVLTMLTLEILLSL